MNKKDIWKGEQAVTTIKSFFEDFGDDVYSRIVLEELLRELLYGQSKEIIPLFDSQGQEGDQTLNDIPIQNGPAASESI